MAYKNTFTDKEKEKEIRLCCYCERAIPLKEFDTYMCKKKGIVSYNFCCNKFEFDPLRKVPVRTKKNTTPEFTSEDFSF